MCAVLVCAGRADGIGVTAASGSSLSHWWISHSPPFYFGTKLVRQPVYKYLSLARISLPRTHISEIRVGTSTLQDIHKVAFYYRLTNMFFFHKREQWFRQLTRLEVTKKKDMFVGFEILTVACSNLKMEAICSSETSVDFQRTTWRHILKDSILQDM
jgi:hypothetical protein